MRTVAKTLALVAAAMAVAATGALAEEFTCTGTVGAQTLDNVRVPPNATCTLEKTRVKGTIKVETDGTLKATKVVVIGNVQGEGAHKVTLSRGSRVGGSVQLVQGGSATISKTAIDGDILLDENVGKLRVLANEVGGSVQVFQNDAEILIRDNRIDGNLQCKENVPPPAGSGNIVQGNKEDQCAKL
jgi:hypothetical protein